MFYSAVSLYDTGNKVVQKADEVIKYIDERAEYYAEKKDWTEYYIPSDDDSTEWCYLINGKKYSLNFTNKRKELLLLERKKKVEQLELF